MELFAELDGLKARMGRFRRVALHVHSPVSRCWGRDSTDPSDRRDQLRADPKPYLRCLDDRYDLVAVTDHMQAWFACESCRGLESCVVLPGMELAVQFAPPFSAMRVHFLAIFPADFSADRIDRIFHDTNIPDRSRRRGDEVLEVQDVHELVKRVEAESGILVAAHVDSDPAGYRAFFRETGQGVLSLGCDEKELDARARELCDQFKKHLIEAGIHAVEIHHPEDAMHYRFRLGETAAEVATVLRNDAHDLAKLAGGRFSYMKMTEVSLDGLRQALRFPDTRIRHSAPARNLPILSGLRISGSQGVMSDLTVALSPNLTCIVGARGSGKSALVDALRYTFGYNRTLGDEIEPDLAKQVKDRQAATLKGAGIELIYTDKSGDGYRIVSNYDARSTYSTTVSDLENRPRHVDDVERDSRFPCRLYGWSEIERHGRDVQRQRILMDRILDLHGVLADRDAHLQALKQDRSRIEAMAVGLESRYTDSKYLQHLKEYRDDLALISQPQVEELFKRVDAAEAQLSVTRKWEQDVAPFLRKLPASVKFPPVSLDSDLQELWSQLGGDVLMRDFEAASESLQEVASALYDKVKQLNTTCQRTRDEATKDLTDQVAGKGDVEAIARKRATAAQNLRKAEEERRAYETELEELRSALRGRREQVIALRSLCASLGERRREGAQSVNDILARQAGPNIGVVVTEASDTEAYDSWLQRLVDTNTSNAYARRRIAAAVRETFGPSGTVEAMIQREIPKGDLRGDDVDVLHRSLCPFEGDVGSGLLRVDPAVLDGLLQCDEHPVDDVVQVTLDGRPLGDRSPGQRCSALLPVIVLGSNVPLIIDQPEDNLDNQLVTNLIIRILHELKEQRQIIVVTHNPNIVVSGDAEQVVVMDYVDGKCVVRRQGSLDNADIMRDVVELMEGGREAFVRRFKRYWPGRDQFRLQDLLTQD